MGRSVPTGVARGLAGGAGMLAWLVGASVVADRDVWLPVNTIGHVLLRGAPPDDLFDPYSLVAGLGVHILASSVLGVVFVAVFVRWLRFPARLSLVAVAVGYGLIVWLIARFGVWPQLDPAAASVFEPRILLVGNVVYGFLLGVGVLRATSKPADLVAAF